MEAHNAFREAYKKLNSEQKKAVDTIEGPVMVIAGPGTGKTQILTLRIANILLKSDTQPENILALTFTESGARAMRERLRSLIGAAAYRVAIHTFHGFADKLIRAYPENFGRIIGGRAASDVEKVEAVEQILSSDTFSHIRPIGNPQFYVPYILDSIATMKREYITPDDLSASIAKEEKELAATDKMHEKGAHKGKVRGEYQKKEKGIEKNKELLLVYREYEALLASEHLYDFEDMILSLVVACEEQEDFLRELQEMYQYMLADEHQDVNGSQNRVLELLASFHENPNLFVVGDEKQAIYRFQGASLENFLYFEEKFSGTTTITLTANYRSGQRILDAAHSLISTESGPAAKLRVPLTAQGEPEGVSGHASIFEYREFSHQGVEDGWVIDAVGKLLTKGIAAEEIAIIVRTNKEVEHFAAMLRKAGIAVHASAESDVLLHPIMHAVHSLMRTVASPEEEGALFAVLHGAYWDIAPGDLVKMLASRSYRRSLADILGDKKLLEQLDLKQPEAILRVGKTIGAARDMQTIEAPHRVLEYLLRESGYLEHILEHDPLEGGRVVRRIYDEIEEMVVRGRAKTLHDVDAMLAVRAAYGLPLTAPFITNQREAVRVMTAHKSKGLEFEHVFVPHLNDNGWGGRRRAEYFHIPLTKRLESNALDKLDDERRLLYVALTRAKYGVYTSYAITNAEGAESVPSRLLEEIDKKHLKAVATDDCEAAFALADILKDASTDHLIEPSVLRELFLERGLSATALNNYLRSPWDYIYRNVLRVPEVQPLHMLFGTALHGVMQRASEYLREEGVVPGATELKAWLERELGRLPLGSKDFTALHKKGFEALVGFFAQKGKTMTKHAEEEFTLRVMFETGEKDVPEIPLTGKLDRLEFGPDGKLLRVVDYKTGKIRTRGQIEGTTKNSKGDYKRQLVFYRLLLELYGDERYQCDTGALVFLEPNTKGEYKEESFTITKAEVDALKKEIIRVAKEIVSGACLSAPCDPKESSYCHLAKLLTHHHPQSARE